MSFEKQFVAIIGAGPSGLFALKNLTSESEVFEPVAFEKNFWAGGVWVYSDQTGVNNYGVSVQSAMYDKLRTNIPKEPMEIPGFPFPKDLTKSFILRQQVLEYLNAFIDAHDLRKYIKTHTNVKEVCPVSIEGHEKVKWNVTYADIRDQNAEKTDMFDAVFVCNGNCPKEHIPGIPGMDTYKGRLLHSRDYRTPEHFEGQRVALLGCRLSGEDICVQIAPFAKKIYACHSREDMPPSLLKYIEQKPPFVRMTENAIVFSDGVELEVDAVIFCTGYEYVFPFLKQDIIQVQNNRVTPLYKHLIHTKYTNLILLSIPRDLAYFPQIHEMSKLAVRIIAGKVRLPSQEDMEKDTEEEFQERLIMGFKAKYTHNLFDRQWQYNEEISKLGGFEPLPPVVKRIWDDMVDKKSTQFEHYKEFEYKITGYDSFKYLSSEEKTIKPLNNID